MAARFQRVVYSEFMKVSLSIAPSNSAHRVQAGVYDAFLTRALRDPAPHQLWPPQDPVFGRKSGIRWYVGGSSGPTDVRVLVVEGQRNAKARSLRNMRIMVEIDVTNPPSLEDFMGHLHAALSAR